MTSINFDSRRAYPWTYFPLLQSEPQPQQMLVVTSTRIDVFALGTDNAVWHIYQTSPSDDAWSDWESLGGPPDGIGSAIVGGDTGGQIQLFVLDFDGVIVWTIWQDLSSGSPWSPWTPLPPALSEGSLQELVYAQSSAASSGLNVALFALYTIDGSLWTMSNDTTNPTAWSPWTSLGSPAPDRPVIPCVGSNQDGRFEVIGLDENGAPWHLWLQDISILGRRFYEWSSWAPLPVPAGSPQPATAGLWNRGSSGGLCSNDEAGALRFYLVDTNNTVWGIGQLTPNTTNQWTSWYTTPAYGGTGAGFAQGGGEYVLLPTLATATYADGDRYLFAIDQSGTVWQIFTFGSLEDSGFWSPASGWEQIGTEDALQFSSIATGTNPDGRAELFGLTLSSAQAGSSPGQQHLSAGGLSQIWRAWQPTAQEAGMSGPLPDELVGTNTVGIVLGGGGARGDFTVGAARYLYDHGVLPGIICGTSVGSINAAKLAEGGTEALDGLEAIWLSLQINEDMYVQADWLAQQPQGLVDALFSGDLSGLGESLGLLSFIPGADLPQLEAIGNFITAFLNNSSLYDLAPIASLLDDPSTFNPALVAASGIKLRLAMTSLEDGTVHYVNELGQDADNTYNSTSLSLAVLGSAAAPMLFTPQSFWGSTWVDGGVKRIIPLDRVIAEGASPVFVIGCDPPTVSPQPAGYYSPGGQGQGLVQIVLRVVEGIMTNAIEEFPLEQLPPNVTVIQPTVAVHDAMTIDPGLISIAMGYGYMRAGEVMTWAGSGQDTTAEYSELQSLSDQIAMLRLQIWQLENNTWAPPSLSSATIISTEPAVDLGFLAQVRSQKSQLRNLICQYISSKLYVDFLPPTDFRSQEELLAIESAPPPYNNVTDYRAWWTLWERHSYDMYSLSPWTQQSVTSTGATDTNFPSSSLVTQWLDPCAQGPGHKYYSPGGGGPHSGGRA